MAPAISTLRSEAETIFRPAARAFLVGYLLDALPTLFKQILRYILIHVRNFRKIRKRIILERTPIDTAKYHDRAPDVASDNQTSLYADGIAPAIQQFPTLLKSMGHAALTAFGRDGVAFACAMAMVGTSIMDMAINDVMYRTGLLRNRTRLEKKSVFSTFISAATASSLALYTIQKAAVGADHDALKSRIGLSNPFRRKSLGVPTPLAPGGHFLARFTSLSVPVTPHGRGSRSPTEKSVLQRDPSLTSIEEGQVTQQVPAGKLGHASPTIDLSLLALVRAMDTLVRATPLLFAVPIRAGVARGPAAGMKADTPRNRALIARQGIIRRLLVKVVAALQNQAEGLTFVVACAIIMFNWFYHPERLPPSYVKWISNLASMDHRALEGLRAVRFDDEFAYGKKDTPPAGVDLLSSLSETMGHPYSWGDVTRLPKNAHEARQMKKKSDEEAIKARAAGRSAPEPYILEGCVGPRGQGKMGGVPCEVIHCGVGGGNCYKNAIYRFLRAWKVCLGIYIPVHLLPRLIFGPGQFRKQPVESIAKVLKGSMRSATFLSTYIASIWFMVCVGRSLLLPRLFPSVSFNYWDAGLGPIMGSWTCGWSVFIEEKRKRAEMALYVAPRALFALAEMARPGWLSQGQKTALQAER